MGNKKKGKKVEVEINERGVPCRVYEVYLANGECGYVDIGFDEDWGNIQRIMVNGKMTAGWGDANDHEEIIKVVDTNTGEFWRKGTVFNGEPKDILRWAEENVWCYADNYEG